MGGTACALPRHAILRYEEVPTHKPQLKEFDEQIRQVYANALVAQGIVDHHGDDVGVEAYKILALNTWTTEHRERLLEILEGLYPPDEDA